MSFLAVTTSHLDPVDYIILVVYIGGILALGVWIGKGMKSGKDYFLGGRKLPWWVIGTSLVATDIGGTDIIGVGVAVPLNKKAEGRACPRRGILCALITVADT